MFNAKIAIIGAGAAGIACATRLIENGFEDVMIIEAEDRIGGRILTLPFADNVVDIGAQWCHGEKGNVVFDLVKDKDLVATSGDIFVTFQCIRSNGEALHKDLVSRFKHILAEIFANRGQDIQKFKGSLGEYLKVKFFDALKRTENKDIDMILAEEFFENFKKIETSESGISVDEVSAAGFAEYWECEGDYLLNWKNKGYETLLKLLMKSDELNKQHGLLDGKIFFGITVSKIKWGPEKGPVMIFCENFDVPFHADHVVITVSLGVLKDRFKTLFSPELPAEKKRAIDKIGFGNVAKVFIEFMHAFWPDDWTGFNTLWRKEDLSSIRKTNQAWFEDVFGFYCVNYQPRVLVAWLVGSGASSIEKLPQAQVIDGCMQLLRRFLHSMKISEPINYFISNWRNNRNFMGAYSFRSISTAEAKSGASELSQPLTLLTQAPRATTVNPGRLVVMPVVLFAGEATSNHYYSTVHGAVETGWREADRLKGFYDFN